MIISKNYMTKNFSFQPFQQKAMFSHHHWLITKMSIWNQNWISTLWVIMVCLEDFRDLGKKWKMFNLLKIRLLFIWRNELSIQKTCIETSMNNYADIPNFLKKKKTSRRRFALKPRQPQPKRSLDNEEMRTSRRLTESFSKNFRILTEESIKLPQGRKQHRTKQKPRCGLLYQVAYRSPNSFQFVFNSNIQEAHKSKAASMYGIIIFLVNSINFSTSLVKNCSKRLKINREFIGKTTCWIKRCA